MSLREILKPDVWMSGEEIEAELKIRRQEYGVRKDPNFSADKALKKLEASREASMTWIDGVPKWRLGETITPEERTRRLILADQRSRRGN